jgi:guanylate kinase
MKRIIIVGKAASGKDHLKEELSKQGYRCDVSITTRPKRALEVDGITYKYVTEIEFEDMIANNLLYDYTKFNGWNYGVLRKSWNQSQVFIFTPSNIKKIEHSDRKDCFIVYLCVDQNVRRQRLLHRTDSDNVERRIVADEEDFKNFIDYDMCITNESFSKCFAVDSIRNAISKID